jgi:hypothetical protein
MAKFKHNFKQDANNYLTNICNDAPARKRGKKMASVYERIEKRRAKLGMSVQQIVDAAKAAGHRISVQAIYQLKNDPKKSLRGSNAVGISIALKCNERWLMNGSGPEERITKDLSPEAQEVLEDFQRITDPETKKQAIALIKLFAKGGTNPQK